MQNTKETLWKLFEETGQVNYYLMFKAVQDKESE